MLELVSEQAQQLQEHINSSLAESMQRMQEGLLSFISTRLAQSAGRSDDTVGGNPASRDLDSANQQHGMSD